MTSFVRSCLAPRSVFHWTHVWRHSRSSKFHPSRILPSALCLARAESSLDTEGSTYQIDEGSPSEQTLSFKAALDFKFVRDNIELVKENCKRRNAAADPDVVVRLYADYIAARNRCEKLRAARNENSRSMKAKLTSEERQRLIEAGSQIKSELSSAELQMESLQFQLQKEGQRLPNLTHPDVPIGSEDEAVVVKAVEQSLSSFVLLGVALQLGEELDLLDFASAALVTGSKFQYLKNAAALMEMALLNWTFQTVVSKGFTPIITPDLIRESVLEKCGFQPRAQNTQVYTIEDSDLALTGTAEVPLGGMYMDKLLTEAELPIKMVAFGHCFRTEAGSPGVASKGLYRVHQFSKVEMFVIAAPHQSEAILSELISIEEELFSQLGLHFKILDMPTGDLGAPAYRKYDIEAWMPGLQRYGEISSASNCTDYQSRRLNIRYRPIKKDNTKKPNAEFVHTLNATACAVPRLIVSILENNQQEDGSITIPAVLQPYMGGMSEISK